MESLATLFKVQEQRAPRLQDLFLPPCHAEVFPRTVLVALSALALPLSHSTYHRKQFKQKYVQWCSKFLASDKIQDDLSVWGGQKFKVIVNQLFSEVRDSDTSVYNRSLPS